MGEADLHEERQPVVLVQERLQRSERARHLRRRRGHEGGFGKRAAGGADPVLAAAQLAGLQVGAAGSSKQLSVDLADEPHRYRQRRQAVQAVVHRAHVGDHLAHIARVPLGPELGFHRQQILQELWVPSIWLERTASLRTYM